MTFEKLNFFEQRYNTEAKGWFEGVYYPRERTLASVEIGKLKANDDNVLHFKSRNWTETEVTGFGIYNYRETVCIQCETGMKDGKWNLIFENPGEKDYKICIAANSIEKIAETVVPAGKSVSLEFHLCSAENVSCLEMYVPGEAKTKDDAEFCDIWLSGCQWKEDDVVKTRAKTTVFVASDSTAQTYEDFYYPQTGWGQVFHRFFEPDAETEESVPGKARYPQCRSYDKKTVIIENRSIGARSSKSFIEEGKWDALLERTVPGDVVLVQWAHNDATAIRPNRYVAPEDFAFFLEKYINSCKARNVTCVLVTPISRRNCDEHDGAFPISFGPYRDVMIRLGAEKNVPVIDLGGKSNALLNQEGPEGAKDFYLWTKAGEYPESAYAGGVSDNAHLQEYGALQYAKIVAESLKEMGFFADRIDSSKVEIKKPLHIVSAPVDLPPDVPQGFALQELHVENGTANFLLVWNDLEGAVSYTVYRKGSVDFQFTPVKTVTAEEKRSSAVMPFVLPASDVYQVYVCAKFENGSESPRSRIIEFRA